MNTLSKKEEEELKFCFVNGVHTIKVSDNEITTDWSQAHDKVLAWISSKKDSWIKEERERMFKELHVGKLKDVPPRQSRSKTFMAGFRYARNNLQKIKAHELLEREE